MFVFSPNSYVETQSPVWQFRAFGRWLSHESEVFMNGISAFIKDTPGSSFAPSAMGGHQRQ